MSQKNFSLLGIAAAAALLAGTAVAGAQTTPPMAAKAAAAAPATASAKPAAAMGKMEMKHGPAKKTAAKPVARKVYEGDAAVDKLNQMSLQSAASGKPMMVPGAGK